MQYTSLGQFDDGISYATDGKEIYEVGQDAKGGHSVKRIEAERQKRIATAYKARKNPKTPKAEPVDDEPGLASDLTRKAAAGASQLVKGVGDTMQAIGLDDAGEFVADIGQNAADYWNAGLSQAQNEADRTKFISEAKGELFGNAWQDPDTTLRKITGLMAESGPATVVGMFGGAVLIKPLINMGFKAATAGIIGGAIGEGGTAAIMSAGQVNEVIDSIDQVTMNQYVPFQRAYHALPKAMSHQEKLKAARQEVKNQAVRDSAPLIGFFTGILGAPSGALLGKYIGREGAEMVARGRLGQAWRQGIGEFVQEAMQSPEESYIIGQVAGEIDPTKIPTGLELAEESVAGGLTGAVYGTALGGIATPLSEEDLEAGQRAERERQEARGTPPGETGGFEGFTPTHRTGDGVLVQQLPGDNDLYVDAQGNEIALQTQPGEIQPETGTKIHEVSPDTQEAMDQAAEVEGQEHGVSEESQATIDRVAADESVEVAGKVIEPTASPEAAKPAVEVKFEDDVIEEEIAPEKPQEVPEAEAETIQDIPTKTTLTELAEGEGFNPPRNEEEVDAAANEAATSPENDLPEPTDAQREEGNYPKGHITGHGMNISIENPKGSVRYKLDKERLNTMAGEDRSGDYYKILRAMNAEMRTALQQIDDGSIEEGFAALETIANKYRKQEAPRSEIIDEVLEQGWKNTMTSAHYGYITGTRGADDTGGKTPESVDVFVGPDFTNDTDKDAYVIDQISPATGKFDEHKVMMGYGSVMKAKAAYLQNYAKGWKGLKHITAVPYEELEKWLDTGNLKQAYKTTSLDEIEITDEYETEEGDTATVTQSATQAITSLDDRIDGMNSLIKCLEKAA